MRIKDCMLIEPFTCEEDENIVDIAKKLRETTLRHIFVVRKGYPVGIISIIDISNRVVAEGKDPLRTSGKDIMSVPIDIISEDDFADAVAKMMMEKGRVMSAVVRDKMMIGIITLNQLISKSGQDE